MSNPRKRGLRIVEGERRNGTFPSENREMGLKRMRHAAKEVGEKDGGGGLSEKKSTRKFLG